LETRADSSHGRAAEASAEEERPGMRFAQGWRRQSSVAGT